MLPLMLKCWTTWPPCPGVFIAVLAVVAAVVAFFDPPPWLKGIATFVFILLMALEVWMIGIDRDANEKQQRAAEKTQLDGFTAVANGIKAAIDESDRNFEAASDKTNAILLNITGGNAYACVVPQYAGGNKFPLVVWNYGKHPLTGVTVTITELPDHVNPQAKPQDNDWADTFFAPYLIGTIAVHDFKPVPNVFLHPEPGADGVAHYWIFISAQNFRVSEALWFRRSKRNPSLWAHTITVSKQVTLTKAEGKVPKGASINRTLFHVQWNDELAPAK